MEPDCYVQVCFSFSTKTGNKKTFPSDNKCNVPKHLCHETPRSSSGHDSTYHALPSLDLLRGIPIFTLMTQHKYQPKTGIFLDLWVSLFHSIFIYLLKFIYFIFFISKTKVVDKSKTACPCECFIASSRRK